MKGVMGHEVRDATVAVRDIIGAIESRTPNAFRRTLAEVALPGLERRRRKMTG